MCIDLNRVVVGGGCRVYVLLFLLFFTPELSAVITHMCEIVEKCETNCIAIYILLAMISVIVVD